MAGLLPKRSEYGRKILEKILGFRKFLETAEKLKRRLYLLVKLQLKHI